MKRCGDKWYDLSSCKDHYLKTESLYTEIENEYGVYKIEFNKLFCPKCGYETVVIKGFDEIETKYKNK